jgi:myosin heavy subunit
MNSKSWIPWVCFVIALAAAGAFYFSVQKKDTQLAQVTAENLELQKTQAEAQEAKSAQDQNQTAELTRLRQESQDLLRLRNEVRQLRDEKQQLLKQLQTAQASVSSQQQQSEQTLQQLAAENQSLRTRASLDQQKQQLETCRNNLRQIEGATQTWALQNQKPAGTIPGNADLLPYFPNQAFPICPAGGSYTLKPAGVAPTCNLPGHTLGQ